MAPFPTLFKGAVVSTLDELRRRKVVSPLPPPPAEDDIKEELAAADSDAVPPHWVCRVCGNPNHLSRQFCFMQVCGAPRGFPGPYKQAVRELPGDQRPKRGKTGETPEPQRLTKTTPPAQPLKPIGVAGDATPPMLDPRFSSAAFTQPAAGERPMEHAAVPPAGSQQPPGGVMYTTIAVNTPPSYPAYAQPAAQPQPLMGYYNHAPLQPTVMSDMGFFAR